MKHFRSAFEFNFATFLDREHIPYEYELVKFKYKPKKRTYTPDFYLPDYKMYIETKGLFVTEDRAKHLLMQEQYPDLDIRFVFQNAKNKLYKGSKTSYGEWCDKHGFKYAEEELPLSWRKNG
tara:strand:+ start:69 stop:434 length:366 start_codon:yes stop_codon:yes gene_type:complete